MPDPNTFDGTVEVRCEGEEEWREVPHAYPAGYGRSVGLADMAHALRSGRPHRCSGEQAFLVLDLMQGFLDASREGRAYTPEVSYQRPAPMPTALEFGCSAKVQRTVRPERPAESSPGLRPLGRCPG